MADILIKFPTRERPDRFWSTFVKWNCPGVRFVVSIDADDNRCNNREFLDGLAYFQNVRVAVGNSKTKVEAINADLAGESFDLLILASDDMVPQIPQPAQRIAELHQWLFPAGDGVLHLNDGRTGSRLNTLPIMDKKYFDRFGYIYHPSYISLWCDNEFQDVAAALGRSIYHDEVVVRHEWIGHHGPDWLHHRNEAFYSRDGRNYETRKAAGFPA